jgi:hypothetical protein
MIKLLIKKGELILSATIATTIATTTAASIT